MSGPLVLVAGALHYDVVVTADRLPHLDETLVGMSVDYLCGGKGSNQAVAAAQHGAPTAMAGRIGDDAFGERLLAHLDRAGVDHSAVAVAPGQSSGMSVAIVTDGGAYGAVIVSAANLTIDAADIEIPKSARAVVLQNEIPEAANLGLAEKARAAGATLLLNAAPARPFETALPALVDLLIVNRVEAAALYGKPMDTVADAVAALKALPAQAYELIVTLGADGVLVKTVDAGVEHFPALPAKVVSTHGAGDAFVGALAARLALEAEMREALRYAQAAAALHVARDPQARRSITPEMVREAARLS